MRRLARPLWCVALVTLVAAALWSWAVLPDPAATHFDGPGRADEWTSPTQTLAVTLGLGLLLMVGMPACMWALARGAGVGVNIPRRDEWFAPQRVAATRRALVDDMLVLASLLGFLMAGADAVLVAANRRTPPALGPEAWLLLGPFLLAVLAWIVGLLRRYGRPPTDDEPDP